MREGAASQTKNMSYSYGYVVRMEGSEYARQEKRTIENETFDTKATLNGKLTLIETQLRPRSNGDKSRLAGKSRIKPVIGGFTKKKFFLIGVGKNNQVEFEALVSIVKGQPNGSKVCLKDVPESILQNTEHMKQVKNEFKDTGLFWPENTQQGRLTLSGQIAFGNCNKEFYKNKGDIEVVEELKKGKSGQRIGLQEINVEGGMSIAVGTKIKKQENKDIIAPGILIKNNNSSGRTLWAGLQGDGKVSKTNGSTQDDGQGTVVLHDWRFIFDVTNNYDKTVGTENNNFGFRKIELSNSERKYFLWDPNYTRVKSGKLVTEDWQNIPWETNIQVPFNSSLIK